MQKTHLLRGLLYSFISASAFASLAIFVKLGYSDGMTTNNMLFYRFISAAFFMLIFLTAVNRRALLATPALLKKSFLAGAVLYTSQSFCFFSSIKYVSPSVTELLLYIYPAMVTLLCVIFFAEKLSVFKIFYIFLILMGFIFIFNDALRSKLEIAGIIYAISAMLIYSTYLIIIQHFMKNENPLSFTFYTIVFAAASYSITLGVPHKLPNPSQLSIIVSLGLISTVIAIGFLFASIEIIGSSLTSIFSSFEPVITILLSAVILHIGMNAYQIIGAVFILSGVFAANLYHLRINR